MTGGGFVEAVGWTLLNFTWQGALIACETALHLVLLRNASAQARYAVACTGLLLCLLWPLASLWTRLSGDAAVDGSVAVMLAGAGAGSPADPGWAGLLGMNLAWIVAAWALCALLLALRMVAGLLWVKRAAAYEARDPAWQARLERLATQCGLERQVRLRIVANLSSPVTAGWWRPVVLVPASLVTTMPAHLLEALLAHELAHIRRHDYLVNLIQNAIEALLFYHPAVWWLSRRIRAERELIADQLAAGQLGEPRRLALALSELEKLQFSTTRLAQAANGGDLMSRIKQLVRPESQALNWKAALPVIGFALAGLVGCAQQPQSNLAAAPDSGSQAAPVRTEPAVGVGAPGLYATGPVTIKAKTSDSEAVTIIADAFTSTPATVEADVVETSAVADFASCSRPTYPPQALARKAQGTVTLGFLVGADGSVRETAVQRSSGDRSLDEAARAALAKCRFVAATVNGSPVEKWTQVQYVWAPN